MWFPTDPVIELQRLGSGADKFSERLTHQRTPRLETMALQRVCQPARAGRFRRQKHRTLRNIELAERIEVAEPDMGAIEIAHGFPHRAVDDKSCGSLEHIHINCKSVPPGCLPNWSPQAKPRR